MKGHQVAVQTFISDNFVPGAVTIEDFPLFPAGKRLIDHTGTEMVIYFDLLTNEVKHVFPKKSTTI
jgi:hypothetical protein